MDRDRILHLLAKQIGQTASDKELYELKEGLSMYPEYHFFNEILQAIEGEKQHREPVHEEKDLVEEGWNLLQQEMTLAESRSAEPLQDVSFPKRIRQEKNNLRIWIGRAAIWVGIIVLASGSFFIWKHKKRQQSSFAAVQMKQISLPFGAPERKILPDSSVVWLNAGSHIRYASNFGQNKREVYLQGEAYFDVRHDAIHPFIVHAGNIEIKVLGTEFNVQAYAGENKIETTLINGKVQVQIAGNPDKKVILTPNEKLTVINSEFTLSGINKNTQKEMSFQVKEMPLIVKGAPIPELAWMQDKLSFQDEPLGELAQKLDRRYNVHIKFDDNQLEKERITGLFVNENIQKALKILQMTTPFLYKIKGDSVFLSK